VPDVPHKPNQEHGEKRRWNQVEHPVIVPFSFRHCSSSVRCHSTSGGHPPVGRRQPCTMTDPSRAGHVARLGALFAGIEPGTDFKRLDVISRSANAGPVNWSKRTSDCIGNRHELGTRGSRRFFVFGARSENLYGHGCGYNRKHNNPNNDPPGALGRDEGCRGNYIECTHLPPGRISVSHSCVLLQQVLAGVLP